MNLSLSGGNRFIFELSNRLAELGHEVTLTHAGMPYYKDWFTPIKATVIECGVSKTVRLLNRFGWKFDLLHEQQKQLIRHSPQCDVNVATFWSTVKPTFESRKGKPFYLVQHYEPLFYAENSPFSALAKESYSYPMRKLCVSQWLTEKFKFSVNIGNGINLQKFKRILSIPKIPYSVLLSKRKPAWKHTDKFTELAEKLQSLGYTVLWSNEDVSDEKLVELLNQAALSVNYSDVEGFGYDMLERMACGCIVVSTPCSEYLQDNMNCRVIPFNATVKETLAVVQEVFSKPLNHLTGGGYCTAAKYGFERVVERFLDATEETLVG